MADSLISQLPPATSVSVDDLVPISQSGVTKKTTVGAMAGFSGSFPPSIDYPMGGHKFTGMGQGATTGDSVPYEQVGPLSRADEPKLAGFMNKDDVTLSWSNATRTLTITPVGASYDFFANNILYTKTGVESIAIPDTTGNHYIYFDSTGVLSVSQTFTNDFILTYAFVAMLNWNATTATAVPDAMVEMHQASMPAQTHLYLHDSLGTTYDLRAGGLLPTVTADGDGSLDAHIEFSATPGAIWDEDVQHIISAHALTDNIPVMYRTGATGVWTFDETSPAMVRTTGTGRAAYNQYTGATWQLTEVTDTQFLLMHLFAIPGITKKWMLIMGQNEYADINSAIAAASTEILSITGIPLAEYKDIASFVIQTDSTYTNGLKSRVRALATGVDFIDWRFAQIGGVGQSGTGGDVVGPVGAVANNIAVFDGSTGKLIKDGGTPASIIGTAIHAATNKATPVDADEFGIWDSVSGLFNKLTLANLKAIFASAYANISGSASQVFSVAAATLAAHATRWDTPNMGAITVTQSGGALTFSGVSHPLTFRSATLTSGAVSTIIASPANLVLPSGGTLGFVSTVQGRIVIAVMNNAGTAEYAICNITGGLQMSETNLISTTAIGAGSTASNVWYSTTSRASLPYKIVGVVDVVNTAGAWGNPVLVQAAGGNAATAMGGFGFGQSWQIVTGSRASGVTYYNNTDKAIFAISSWSANTSGGFATVSVVNGVTIPGETPYAAASGYLTHSIIIIPPGGSYSVTGSNSTLVAWAEFRQ